MRPATADDAEEMVRLAAMMFASIGLDAGAAAWREAGVEHVRRRLFDDLGAFVVEDPDQPDRLISSAAGTIAIRLPTPKNLTGLSGYVQWVCTDPAHRRQGHSRAVMEALLAWYVERGVPYTELHATRDGEPLYRELGYLESDNSLALRRFVPLG